MAEEAKETAGAGWRQTVLPIFGKKTQHVLMLWLKLTEPLHGCAISWVASFRASKLCELNQGL